MHRLFAIVALPIFLFGAACSGCSDDIDLNADDAGEHQDVSADDRSADDASDGDDTTDTDDSDAGEDGDTSDEPDADAGSDTGDDLDAGDDPDSGAPDSGDADAGDTGASPPAGLSEPCENGDGWTLFRFHYELNPGSPTIEVWDADCTYSVGDQTCQIQQVTSGFGDMPTTSDGYPIVNTSSNFIRIRFSVEALTFTSVSAHVRARSYSSSSSTDMRLVTQLHGDVTAGPVSQAFSYDWYDIDFTDYLHPDDDPGLTAIDVLAAQGGSSEMAVRAMEVCVE